ncbi:hypothetical protein RB195_017718 [Necator americanus]|uniref:Helix-turn-helix domain-containing protein n=1 Tax=Necator americanus TaxID=51031 RepID=A0ABR1CA44_NECAM
MIGYNSPGPEAGGLRLEEQLNRVLKTSGSLMKRSQGNRVDKGLSLAARSRSNVQKRLVMGEVGISNGTHQTKWYRKPTNKDILVHFLPAHPPQMKKAVINSMIRTAGTVCSGPEDRKESLTLAHEIANYKNLMIMKCERLERDDTKVNEHGIRKTPPQIRYLSAFLISPMK